MFNFQMSTFLSDSWNEADWERTALGLATFLSKRQHASEYVALSAQFHFLLPCLLLLALTDGTINKPAEVASLKFPCRTISLNLSRARSYHPAGFALLLKISLYNKVDSLEGFCLFPFGHRTEPGLKIDFTSSVYS
jgi:hypothetical protein